MKKQGDAGGAGRCTGLSARRARRTKSRGPSCPFCPSCPSCPSCIVGGPSQQKPSQQQLNQQNPRHTIADQDRPWQTTVFWNPRCYQHLRCLYWYPVIGPTSRKPTFDLSNIEQKLSTFKVEIIQYGDTLAGTLQVSTGVPWAPYYFYCYLGTFSVDVEHLLEGSWGGGLVVSEGLATEELWRGLLCRVAASEGASVSEGHMWAVPPPIQVAHGSHGSRSRRGSAGADCSHSEPGHSSLGPWTLEGGEGKGSDIPR